MGVVITVCIILIAIIFIACQKRVKAETKQRNHKKDNKEDMTIFVDLEKSPDIIPSANKGTYLHLNKL